MTDVDEYVPYSFCKMRICPSHFLSLVQSQPPSSISIQPRLSSDSCHPKGLETHKGSDLTVNKHMALRA